MLKMNNLLVVLLAQTDLTVRMRQTRFMMISFIFLATITLLVPSHSFANEPMPLAIEEASDDPTSDLFSQLKKQRDLSKASSTAKSIAERWDQSGSSTIDTLMQWAFEASQTQQATIAEDFFDQVILLKPRYAQAYYQRGLHHRTNGQPRKAMSDFNKALELEPRHFMALKNIAEILEDRDLKEQALIALDKYLALYPADKDAQAKRSTISEDLAGTRG